jgi:hypothetical protein
MIGKISTKGPERAKDRIVFATSEPIVASFPEGEDSWTLGTGDFTTVWEPAASLATKSYLCWLHFSMGFRLGVCSKRT